MPPSSQSQISTDAMDTLSRFVLSPSIDVAREVGLLQRRSPTEFNEMLSLAHSNHVVIRGFSVYRELMAAAGDAAGVHRAEVILIEERARIAKATSALERVCDVFAKNDLDLTVIKTLDHWPDFGSDIDLYTNSTPERVISVMQKSFSAIIASRSWGDRLAGKWNFEVPGLKDPIEIHMERLGQTGEQLTLAKSLPTRSRMLSFGERRFSVTAATDRILIATLQRMYRHFYFRLCDIVDSAELVRSGSLNFEELKNWGTVCGIWPGASTYLVLVSDYVTRYSGSPLVLPDFVRQAAYFDGRVMYSGAGFLRVPILPHSARLYATQLLGTLRRRELRSFTRLGLLPCVAGVAAIGYKLTGSDKGIW